MSEQELGADLTEKESWNWRLTAVVSSIGKMVAVTVKEVCGYSIHCLTNYPHCHPLRF